MSKFSKNNDILNEKGVESYEQAIELAYQITLRKSLKDPSKFTPISEDPDKIDNNRYRIFLLNNNDPKDRLFITMNTASQLTFSQIKFYKGGRLKQDIIQYYKPYGFYVKGPREMELNTYNTEGESTGSERKWVIDLYKFKDRKEENLDIVENPTDNSVDFPMDTSTDIPVNFAPDDED